MADRWKIGGQDIAVCDRNADAISFDNTGTGLTSDNVQDAVEEINSNSSDMLDVIKTSTYTISGGAPTTDDLKLSVANLPNDKLLIVNYKTDGAIKYTMLYCKTFGGYGSGIIFGYNYATPYYVKNYNNTWTMREVQLI